MMDPKDMSPYGYHPIRQNREVNLGKKSRKARYFTRTLEKAPNYYLIDLDSLFSTQLMSAHHAKIPYAAEIILFLSIREMLFVIPFRLMYMILVMASRCIS